MGLASILKRRRKGQLESIYYRDSISSLPDDILGIILSLLPTKLAASTSVLSKRWINLLSLVDSSLDFDDSIFLYPAAARSSSSGFADFVDKTVALLSSCPIKTLSVSGRCYEKSRVDEWIRVALQRSLSELHLRCPHRIDKDRVELLFRSKTLVKLTLSDGCVIEDLPDGHVDFTDKPNMDEKINEDRFFPSLKSLYLGDIVIDESYYFKLILMCPVLEELFIRNDGVSHPPSWIGLVPSYTLKRLVIDYIVLVPEYKHVYSYIEVRIGGPQNLVYFEFSSYVHANYGSFGEMESLVEARLDLRLLESTTRYDDDTETGDEYLHVVNGFDDIFGDASILIWRMASYVKILHLSPYSLEALHFGCQFVFTFDNLVTLSFESDKDKSWQVLPRLLRITPMLQNLVIKGLLHRVTGRCGDVCPCYHRPIHKRVIGGRKPKVSCLPSLPLKVLEISGYGGTCREIKQMRHFLGKLQCLQLVKIGVQPESDCNKLRSNLMRLARLSSNCIIQFI